MGGCFLGLCVLPGAAGIFQGEEGVVNLVVLDRLSQQLGGFWLGFLASVTILRHGKVGGGCGSDKGVQTLYL